MQVAVEHLSLDAVCSMPFIGCCLLYASLVGRPLDADCKVPLIGCFEIDICDTPLPAA